MAGLLSNLKDVIQIVRLTTGQDGKNAPVEGEPVVVFANVKASVEDHQPKLHGNQVIEWDETIIRGHHDVYVKGLYPELGGQGNGYAVIIDGVTLARITNIQRCRQFGVIGNYSKLICEEVSS